jgi:hypothetical protein
LDKLSSFLVLLAETRSKLSEDLLRRLL